jgi:hypothetical protein
MVERYSGSARLSKKQAQIVGEVLQKLAERDGEVTPAAVVLQARSKSSPLHRYFTWDVRKAAEERLLDQARMLIRSVKVVFVAPTPTAPVRAFAKIVRPGGKGYLPMQEVMRSSDYRNQLLARALEELHVLEMRYKHLEELSEVFAAVGKVRKRKAA